MGTTPGFVAFRPLRNKVELLVFTSTGVRLCRNKPLYPLMKILRDIRRNELIQFLKDFRLLNASYNGEHVGV